MGRDKISQRIERCAAVGRMGTTGGCPSSLPNRQRRHPLLRRSLASPSGTQPPRPCRTRPWPCSSLTWRYLAFEVPPDELRSAIAGAQAMKFIGLNLTLPHKLLAVDMVDELDESARTWGAVNTIRFEAQDVQGDWLPLRQFAGMVPARLRSHGFNTDADAITRALKDDLGVEPAGARVLLLGAGGAGRTAALKLAFQRGRRAFLVNRTVGKAEALAAEVRQRYPAGQGDRGLSQTAPGSVMNATSLGLNAGDELPFDPGNFSPQTGVGCI